MNFNHCSVAKGQQNLLCPIHAAQKEYLVHICVTQNCQQQPLLCVLCKEQSHRYHQTKSFGVFSEIVQNMKYDGSIVQAVRAQTDKVKQKKAQYIEQTNKILKMVQQLIAENQKNVFNLLNETERRYDFLREQYQRFDLDPFQISPGLKPIQLFEDVNRQKQMYLFKTALQRGTLQKLNDAVKQNSKHCKGFARNLCQTILNRLKEFHQQTKNINNAKNPNSSWIKNQPMRVVNQSVCKGRSKSPVRIQMNSSIRYEQPRQSIKSVIVKQRPENPINPEQSRFYRNQLPSNQQQSRVSSIKLVTSRVLQRPRTSKPQNLIQQFMRPVESKPTFNAYMRSSRVAPQ